MKGAELELCEVDFGYGADLLLRDLHLKLPRGSFTALIGPNGSGKSTLLSLAAGLLKPLKGEVRLEGEPLGRWDPAARARTTALVQQSPRPPEGYLVREWVLLGRTPYMGPMASPSPADREAVAAVLEEVGLTGFSARPVDALSGGEQARVALAAALAQQPRLLLLDEPTAHLDPVFQFELLSLVRRRCKSGGVTVLTALHDLNLAGLWFDRLILLREGRLLADGPPEEVLTAPLLQKVYGRSLELAPRPGFAAPAILPRSPGGGGAP